MSTFLVVLALLVAGAVAVLAVRPRGGAVKHGAVKERPVKDGAGRKGSVAEGAGNETSGHTAGQAAGKDAAGGEEAVAELDGLAEPLANLPPVLLPEHPQAADIDQIRFSVAFRGYRMDQVDEVLDRLRAELAAREAEIRDLQAEAWRQQ